MGSYTEYVAVKAAVIARKPSNLSFEEAASVPVASQTAWHGIFTHGHLEKGRTILIHWGAGAVGAYAVQLASHAGANVIATASGDDEAYLKSIGASLVIDYREAQFERIRREKVDVVFDLVGGDTQKRSFLVLKEGGYLVSAVQPVLQEEATKHHVSGTMMRLVPSGDVLGRIARLLEEGTVPRRRDRLPTRRGGPGMEGHRREPTRRSWTLASCAGSCKDPVTRQDRAPSGLALGGEENMAERIHELLLRNLQEVFGEGDPTKRRSAIKELYADDCALYVAPVLARIVP